MNTSVTSIKVDVDDALASLNTLKAQYKETEKVHQEAIAKSITSIKELEDATDKRNAQDAKVKGMDAKSAGYKEELALLKKLTLEVKNLEKARKQAVRDATSLKQSNTFLKQNITWHEQKIKTLKLEEAQIKKTSATELDADKKQEQAIRKLIQAEESHGDALKNKLLVYSKAEQVGQKYDKLIRLNEKALRAGIITEKDAAASKKNLARAREEEITALSRSTQARGSAINTLVRHLRQVETFIFALYTLKKAYDLTLGAGHEFNKLIERETIGYKLLISQNLAYQDSLGNTLTELERYTLAQTEAAKAIELVKKINIETPHSFGETLQIMKLLTPQVLKYGGTLEDTAKITQRMSVIAASMGVEFQQFLKTVDSALSGEMKESGLKRSLSMFGLTNEGINEIKKRNGDVIGYVLGSLEAASVAGVDMFNSWGGATAQLATQWHTLWADIQEPMFQEMKEGIQEFSKYLKENDEGIKETILTVASYGKELTLLGGAWLAQTLIMKNFGKASALVKAELIQIRMATVAAGGSLTKFGAISLLVGAQFKKLGVAIKTAFSGNLIILGVFAAFEAYNYLVGEATEATDLFNKALSGTTKEFLLMGKATKLATLDSLKSGLAGGREELQNLRKDIRGMEKSQEGFFRLQGEATDEEIRAKKALFEQKEKEIEITKEKIKLIEDVIAKTTKAGEAVYKGVGATELWTAEIDKASRKANDLANNLLKAVNVLNSALRGTMVLEGTMNAAQAEYVTHTEKTITLKKESVILARKMQDIQLDIANTEIDSEKKAEKEQAYTKTKTELLLKQAEIENENTQHSARNLELNREGIKVALEAEQSMIRINSAGKEYASTQERSVANAQTGVKLAEAKLEAVRQANAEYKDNTGVFDSGAIEEAKAVDALNKAHETLNKTKDAQAKSESSSSKSGEAASTRAAKLHNKELKNRITLGVSLAKLSIAEAKRDATQKGLLTTRKEFYLLEYKLSKEIYLEKKKAYDLAVKLSSLAVGDKAALDKKTIDAKIDMVNAEADMAGKLNADLIETAEEFKSIFTSAFDDVLGGDFSGGLENILTDSLDVFTDRFIDDMSTSLANLFTSDKGGSSSGGGLGSLGITPIWGAIAGAAVSLVGALTKKVITEAEMKEATGITTVLSDTVTNSITNLSKNSTTGLKYSSRMAESLEDLVMMSDKAASNVGGLLTGEGYETSTNMGFWNDRTEELISAGIKLDAASIDELNAGQLTASQYMTEKITDSGWLGIGSGESLKTRDLGAAGSDIMDPINQAYLAGVETLQSATEALGLSEEEFTQISKSWETSISRLNFVGKSQVEIAEMINGVISADLDTWGDTLTSVAGYVSDFKLAGEGTGETIIRLANDFELVESSFRDIGLVLPSVADGGLLVAESLIEAAGGMKNFAAEMDFFTQNFFTESEQQAMAVKALNAETQNHNSSMVTSAAQYRNLVILSMANVEAQRIDVLIKKQALDVAIASGAANIALLQSEYDLSHARQQLLADEAAWLLSLGKSVVDAFGTIQTAADGSAISISSCGSSLNSCGLEAGACGDSVDDLADSLATLTEIAGLKSEWMDDSLSGAQLKLDAVIKDTGIIGVDFQNFLEKFSEVAEGGMTQDELGEWSELSAALRELNNLLATKFSILDVQAGWTSAEKTTSRALELTVEDTGITGVDESNFLEKFNEAVELADGNFTTEDIANWQALSNAIKAANEAAYGSIEIWRDYHAITADFKQGLYDTKGGVWDNDIYRASFESAELALKALEEQTGITGVTTYNFIDRFNKAVLEGLSEEEIKEWEDLGAALLDVEDAVGSLATTLDSLALAAEYASIASSFMAEQFALTGEGYDANSAQAVINAAGLALEAVHEATGIYGVTSENYLVKLAEANAAGLSDQELENWKSLGDALLAVDSTYYDAINKQQKMHDDAMKAYEKELDAINKLVDKLEDFREKLSDRIEYYMGGAEDGVISKTDIEELIAKVNAETDVDTLIDLGNDSIKMIDDYYKQQTDILNKLINALDTIQNYVDNERLNTSGLIESENTYRFYLARVTTAIENMDSENIDELVGLLTKSASNFMDKTRDSVANTAMYDYERNVMLNEMENLATSGDPLIDAIKDLQLEAVHWLEQIDIHIQAISIATAGDTPPAPSDPVPPTMPIISDPVTDAYADILGRAPSQASLDYWTNEINTPGGVTTENLGESIGAAAVMSGEKTKRWFVDLLYKEGFGRTASAAELDYWAYEDKTYPPSLPDLFESIDPSYHHFAEGGIVTRPTRALIGEAGYNEAVIPLKNPSDPLGQKELIETIKEEMKDLKEEIKTLQDINIKTERNTKPQRITSEGMVA